MKTRSCKRFLIVDLIGVMIFPILVIAFERVCVLQAINTNLITCMLLSSLYHLATVAWDRYVAVSKWKDYKVIVTKRCLKWLANVCWTLAVVTTVPGTIIDLKTIQPQVVNPSIIYMFYLNVCYRYHIHCASERPLQQLNPELPRRLP